MLSKELPSGVWALFWCLYVRQHLMFVCQANIYKNPKVTDVAWIPHTATSWVATTADGRFLCLRVVWTCLSASLFVLDFVCIFPSGLIDWPWKVSLRRLSVCFSVFQFCHLVWYHQGALFRPGCKSIFSLVCPGRSQHQKFYSCLTKSQTDTSYQERIASAQEHHQRFH